MVPNGWVIKNLEDIVSKSRKITYGIVVPGPNTPNGNLMIRAQDYSFGWKSVDSIYRVSDEVHKSYKRSQVEEGDVLLTIVGSIGKTAVVPKYLSGANLTQQTARLSFSENDGNYFHAVLSSPIGKREVYRFAKSGVQPSLNLSDISKFKIPVPPLPEQRKIAKILSTWDKAINTTERLIDNSKQQKKALMQQLLIGKKRLLDDSGKQFEGEWEDLHLADIASIKKGKALSAKNVISGTYPVIAGGKTSPYSHNEYTHENIVTVSASGAYAGYVSHHECKIWASDCSVVTEKKDNCLLFIFQFLKLNQNKIYSMQSGGAQPHIYPKDLQVLKVKKPNLDEQLKIASVLTNADQEIELLEQQLADLKQEKKALMQQLLTGKRRVKVDDKEVG